MEGGAVSANVLFDIPGPRARARNRLLGVAGSLLVAAILGYVIYRFYETGQFDGQKWSILEYKNPQQRLVDGFIATLKAAGVAAVLAVALGAVLAAGRLSDHRVFRAPSFVFVELFRAIPLLLLMFAFYYGAPALGFRTTPFMAVVLGLMLYNGAVLAELFRAGVDSVPRGQSEAAYALGMGKTQVMVSVLLPQAIRAMLPAIISQLVVLLKDTALGFLVTYEELLDAVKDLSGAQEFAFPLIPLALVGGGIYVATCMLLSWFANWLEKRLGRTKKTSAPMLHADPGAAMGQGGTV